MAAISDKDYANYLSIRKESAHQNLVKLEELSGVADGSNAAFTAGRTYIVDRNGNDNIDVAVANGDVIVYVNNTPVVVNAVDPVSGLITLASAPANGATVLATYAYSVLSDAEVDDYRKQAIDFVHRSISKIVAVSDWVADTDVPPLVRSVVRIYAAGLILIGDQGLNTDNEESSKDGYKRLQTAKNLLKEYISQVTNPDGTTKPIVASGKSDGELFARNRDLSTYNDSVSREDAFMRKD